MARQESIESHADEAAYERARKKQEAEQLATEVATTLKMAIEKSGFKVQTIFAEQGKMQLDTYAPPPPAHMSCVSRAPRLLCSPSVWAQLLCLPLRALRCAQLGVRQGAQEAQYLPTHER